MNTTTTTFPATREDSLTGHEQGRRVWPTLWLYVLVAWLAGGALIELQPLTHISTQVIEISQFAPSVAVLVVLARHRAAALQPWRGPLTATLRRTAAAAAMVVAVFGSCLAFLALTKHPVHVTSLASLGEPFWLIVVAQLVGACGEELGWRAFLQPHLEQRYSRLTSAIIVGILWGTWHVMYLGDGPLFFALFVLMAIALSVIMAELTSGVSRLPVAGVFHWLINLATLLLLNFANGSLTDITTLTVGFTAGAIIVTTTATLRSRATSENS